MDAMNGACLCGAVRFVARRAPRWVAHCHCSMCRRAHGAPYVTWAGFDSDAVEIISGGDLASTHQSSDTGRRRFCSRCGSPLFFEGTRWPGEIHVARALLPDDAPMPLPQAHAYWGSHASWVIVEDALPRLPDPC